MTDSRRSDPASRFVGTARAYAQFRAGYPDHVLDSLADGAGVGKTSRVLDIGCGPGTCTLPLAARAGTVIAVDVDEGMLREGRRIADERHIDNVEWLNLAAEDIDFPDGHFALIVIASAFHWMDRPRVASLCRSMLQGNALLAVLGNPTPLLQIRQRDGVGAAIERPEAVLRAVGFSDVSVTYVDQTQEWTVERFLGFLRSTSFHPHERLGADFDAFATELDAAIRGVEPSGRWTLDIPVEVIVGHGRLYGRG